MILSEQSVMVDDLKIGDVITFDSQLAKMARFPGREARVIGLGEYTRYDPEGKHCVDDIGRLHTEGCTRNILSVFVCLGLIFDKTFCGQPIVDGYGNSIQVEIFSTLRTGSRVKRKLREEVSRG